MSWKYFSRIVNQQDTVEIAASQKESAVIETIGLTLVGINFPAAFDGSSLFFKSADTSGGTYSYITDLNGQLVGAHAVGPNTRVRLGDILEDEEYLKIVSSATETALRTLTLIFKRN